MKEEIVTEGKKMEKKNNCTKTASYLFHFLHFDKNLGGKIITQGTRGTLCFRRKQKNNGEW